MSHIDASLDIQRVLRQIEATRERMRGDFSPIQTERPFEFGALLKQSIDQVNGLQQTSSHMADAFERGEPNLNLSDVMVASQKAGIAFQSMVQVRNKLVDAYRDVMNMPM